MRPNYASSQIALGHVELLDEQLDAAIEHLETGRRLSPQNPAAYSLLAAAYRKSGRLDQAEAMLTILARLNQEEAQRIRTAPGDNKAIPGSSGDGRGGKEKPLAGIITNQTELESQFNSFWRERVENGRCTKPFPSSMARI